MKKKKKQTFQPNLATSDDTRHAHMSKESKATIESNRQSNTHAQKTNRRTQKTGVALTFAYFVVYN